MMKIPSEERTDLRMKRENKIYCLLTPFILIDLRCDGKR